MKTLIPVSKDFEDRLVLFLKTLQNAIDEKPATRTRRPYYFVSYETGTKYVKIVSGRYGSQSAHCFIDFSGNVYKAESWKEASEDIKGSIYDEDFGIETAMTSIFGTEI